MQSAGLTNVDTESLLRLIENIRAAKTDASQAVENAPQEAVPTATLPEKIAPAGAPEIPPPTLGRYVNIWA